MLACFLHEKDTRTQDDGERKDHNEDDKDEYDK